METTLSATTRSTDRGKSGTRKVRSAGALPAIVYGEHIPTRAIQVETRALTELFRKTNDRNTVVQLELDGKTLPCLVREVQRHPLSREIQHVDFYAVPIEHPVVVEVPVVAVGKAKGLALGGRVQVQRRRLAMACAHDRIPKTIEVDVTPLDVGDCVRVSAMTPPEGAKFVFDQDFPVVTILGKPREIEEAPAAAAAAPAEGAVPAAPAAEGKGKGKA